MPFILATTSVIIDAPVIVYAPSDALCKLKKRMNAVSRGCEGTSQRLVVPIRSAQRRYLLRRARLLFRGGH